MGELPVRDLSAKDLQSLPKLLDECNAQCEKDGIGGFVYNLPKDLALSFEKKISVA
jgi:hypothetical protein